MATLEKIRNRAGFLIFVVGIALFAFIIGDFLNSGTTYFGPSRDRVGKVAGKELSYTEFQRNIATVTEVMKMQYRQPSDGEVRDMVWNTFVEQAILNSEAAATGLSVTPTELNEATLGANPHQLMRNIPFLYNQQNQFDQTNLIEILNSKNRDWSPQERQMGMDTYYAQLREQWLYYWEGRIKTQILADKYQTLIIKAMSATNAQAEIIAGLNSKETDAACARRPYYTVPDSVVTMTDKELKAKYDAIKDRMFQTDGYRNLRAVSFDIVPSTEDYMSAEKLAQETKSQLGTIPEDELGLFISQINDPSVPFVAHFRPEKDIDAAFQDFAFVAPKGAIADVVLSNGFYKTAKVMSDVQSRPDSVKVSHILVQRSSDEESQRVADSLVVVLNKGADFAILVAKYSANTASVAEGGELGWFREGATGLNNFDDAVFTAKTGSFVTVAVPQQGVHVIKILERTAPVKKIKLAEVAIKIEPSSATYSKIYNQANQFAVANRTLESFENAAREQSLIIRPLDRLAKNQFSTYVFDQSRAIIRWAWENKEGAVSEVFDVPNAFVVVALSQAVDQGFIPFAHVKDQVKAELLRDKKAEIIINELKGNTDLASISPVDTLKNIRFSQSAFPGNVGREPVVAAVAFVTNVGEVSAPFKGNMGVLVLKALDKRDVQADVNAEARLLNNNIFSVVSRGLFESLKKNAKVEDNRFYFF